MAKAATALEAAGWEVVEATPPEMEQCQELWARMLSCDMPAMVGAASEIMSDSALGLLNDLIGRFPPDEVPAILVHTEYHRLGAAWAGFFAANPVLITPVWTQPPFAHDADLGEGGIDLMLDLMRCITPVNLLGIPAVAVPVGVADGIPQGVQVIADRYREDLCLDAAADVEAALGTITPMDPVTA
jgi:amidase